MYCGSGFGRSTRPRRTYCSTICSARLSISMRSRPVSSATPDRSRSLSRRSPGNSSAGASLAAAGREEDVAEALCHHAVKAQDWSKVDRYGHLAARKAFARSAFRDATEYFKAAMNAVDKQPESTAREQRAIDLRIEARLAFVSFGSIEEWVGLGQD